MDSNWQVAAGEESTEAVILRRVPSDPRLSAAFCRAGDKTDSQTPVIPLISIEEANQQENSASPFLITAAAMNDETMALAMTAITALNKCVSSQGEHTEIDMDSFIQLLNSSKTIRDVIDPSLRNELIALPNANQQSDADT
ncbi:hypothetical protein DCAR_0518992 [Daucus carota subsp. sativus]|uniref:Uncharacterized protein n=2 Tax=Daucus carota subsp. sativus TaxID=79200 RepID=A0A161ZYG9_DAUCS|nr:hypothetical protein DCAR_0518992 [Daucus carota subsp. sativus]